MQNLWVLVKRLFVVFLIYQITRLVFYYYNIEHFSDVSFTDLLYMLWGGFRFDLTAILYINLLFITLSVLPFKLIYTSGYQSVLFILFIITNAVGFAFNILDVFYFDYILKRSTVELFMFTSEDNMGLLLWQFLKDFWWGFILWFVFLYITLKWYKSIKLKRLKYKTLLFYPISLALFLGVVYFSIVGMRGGFTRTTRPISLNNAGTYTTKPLEMAIVLNTPFSIIRTFNKQAFKPKKYYSETEVNSIYSPVQNFKTDSLFTNQNLVIIIVESLAKEYIGALNKDAEDGLYTGYTPFLDSLITKSHTCTNAYANGRKSIDALPSVVASVPSLVQPYILSPYSTNKINGIGNILKEKGYQTAFFHGGPNGSMGFDAFMNMAGHDLYFSSEDYENQEAFDGNWGIWDEEYLQFTAEKLAEFEEPFLGSIFTLSSHHPFKVPEKYKDTFTKGTLDIHQPVQYTDFALKRFFKTASQMPWYENTLFVITADHCNQTFLPSYKSSIGGFAIPIIIFDPSKPENAQLDDRITQQADILPKVLRKMNYSGDFISFGSDALKDSDAFAINYTNQTWQYFDNHYLLQYRDEKPVGLFRYKTDKLLENNLLSKELDTVTALEKQLKAYIQQYYNRLIENNMVVK